MDATIQEIIKLNQKIAYIWGNAQGWTPDEVDDILSRSRLDRQVSLSHCLKYWFNDMKKESSEGSLILAWANLGSLIEGSLQLFLTLYYDDYKRDAEESRANNLKSKCPHARSNCTQCQWKAKVYKITDPDSLTMEKLKIFYKKNDILDVSLIDDVQDKRNAIHAYKDRDIGSFDDFKEAVRKYLVLLKNIYNSTPPEPDLDQR